MASPAVRRLQRDLKALAKNSLPFVGVAPKEDDFMKWYVNLLGPVGTPYAGILIRFELEFREEYPQRAPDAYFITDIVYTGGAQTIVGGRIILCMDLFGNFKGFHGEWGTDGVAAGWSPAYTIETIITQVQTAITDLFSKDPVDIARAKRSAETYICKETGHDGSDPSKYWPSVFIPETEKTPEPVEKITKKLEEVKIHIPNPATDHFICYSSQKTLADGAVLGYGISANSQEISTPAEYLSLEAFEAGVRAGSRNQQFDFFLPLYINTAHWTLSGKYLRPVVGQIRLCGKRFLTPMDSAPELVAFSILASLMNTMVVQISDNRNNLTANDRFIDAYFGFYRLIKHIALLSPNLSTFATSAVAKFTRNKDSRTKREVPNLGEWLLWLLLTRQNFKDVASSFIEEVTARNVKWFVEKDSSLRVLTHSEEWLEKVFTHTEVSRKLICFQVQFIQLVRMSDLSILDQNFGLPSEELRHQLKTTYRTVSSHRKWDDYYRFLGLSTPSSEQHFSLFSEAFRRAKEQKYWR